MKVLEAPSALRMPISRVRCSTAMYMERHTTAKPITTPIPMITTMNSLQPVDIVHVERRDVVLHGVDGVVRPEPSSARRATRLVLAGLSSLT